MLSGHDIAMSIRRAYLAMHRQTDAHLARHGVTADQFVVLSVLAETDGITQQDLVRRVFSDPNTIRSMLVLLEKQGLVARDPHPTDGRALSVTLTPRGRRMHGKLWASIQPLQDRLLSLFGRADAERFVECLARVSQAFVRPARRDRRSPFLQLSSVNAR